MRLSSAILLNSFMNSGNSSLDYMSFFFFSYRTKCCLQLIMIRFLKYPYVVSDFMENALIFNHNIYWLKFSGLPLMRLQNFLFFLIFIFTSFYFTILYWFCHTLTRISFHECYWSLLNDIFFLHLISSSCSFSIRTNLLSLDDSIWLWHYDIGRIIVFVHCLLK